MSIYTIRENQRYYTSIKFYTDLAEQAKEDFNRTLPAAMEAAFKFHEVAQDLGLDEEKLLDVAGKLGTLNATLRAFEYAFAIQRGERVLGNSVHDELALDTMARLHQLSHPEAKLLDSVVYVMQKGW